MATAENQLNVLLQAMEEVVEQPEDLEGCEKLIEGSSLKNNFLRIGQALVTINDRQLYKRDGCTSFTQYIEQKGDFGFGPRQALRLVAATRLVRNFPPNIALPTSERQVRALVGMDQQAAVKVWVKANLIATETGVPLTHRLVESVLGKEKPAAGGRGATAGKDAGEAGGEGGEAPASTSRKRPAPNASPQDQTAAGSLDASAVPTYVIRAVHKLYGGTVDLDPYTNDKTNNAVQATRFFMSVEEGLAAETKWAGKVFVHPPATSSSPPDTLPARYLARAFEAVYGAAPSPSSPTATPAPAAPTSSTEVLLLLKAAPGQPWFTRVFDLPHCWLAETPSSKRLVNASSAAGGGGGGGADGSRGTRGLVAVYLGRRVREFCLAFTELGHIPGQNGWTGSKYRA